MPARTTTQRLAAQLKEPLVDLLIMLDVVSKRQGSDDLRAHVLRELDGVQKRLTRLRAALMEELIGDEEAE